MQSGDRLHFLIFAILIASFLPLCKKVKKIASAKFQNCPLLLRFCLHHYYWETSQFVMDFLNMFRSEILSEFLEIISSCRHTANDFSISQNCKYFGAILWKCFQAKTGNLVWLINVHPYPHVMISVYHAKALHHTSNTKVPIFSK